MARNSGSVNSRVRRTFAANPARSFVVDEGFSSNPGLPGFAVWPNVGVSPMKVRPGSVAPVGSQTRVLKFALATLNCLLLEPRSLGITEVATRLGLPKSTTFRVLSSLVELDVVEKDPASLRYSLNTSVFRFIHELAAHFGPLGRFSEVLRKEAKSLNCSLYICSLSSGNTYVVAASGSLGDSFALGLHAPVHASSAGKVLVAAKAKEQWSVYAPEPDTPKLTKYTNTSAPRFFLELEAAKKNGVAWSREETSLGYVSIAAPIKEKLRIPRLAVAMLLPKESLAFCDLNKLEKDIKSVAKRLENAY